VTSSLLGKGLLGKVTGLVGAHTLSNMKMGQPIYSSIRDGSLRLHLAASTYQPEVILQHLKRDH